MGELMRNKDWKQHSFGAPANWPQSLRTTLSIILNSRFPMFLFWGPNLICFYNDAFRPSLGTNGKHPEILGAPGKDAWPEIWEIIKPLIDTVLTTGEPTWNEDQLIPIYRNGRLEDVYWTFSYSPVADETAKITGVFVTCTETTEKLLYLDKLSNAAKRYQQLVNEAVAATAIFTGRELVLQYANDAALKIWNQDRTAIGKPLLKFLPELEGQPWPDQLLKVLETGIEYIQEESLVYFKKGTTIEPSYFDFSYKPLKDDLGTNSSLLLTGIDVTEKVLNRKKLEDSKKQLQFAIDATGLGTWAYNPKNKTFTANSRLREWFGVGASDEINLEDAMAAISEEDRPRVVAAIQYALNYESDGFYEEAYSIVHPLTGKERRVLAKGRALFNKKNIAFYFSGTLQDVTEQFLARRKVEESEENLRLMILQAPVGMCRLTGSNFCVEIINDRMLELWGKQNTQVQGKPLFEGFPEARGQGFEGFLDTVLSTGERVKADEMPLELPRGNKLETVYVNFVIEALKDISGTVYGVLAIASEVTQQVAARLKVEAAVTDLTLYKFVTDNAFDPFILMREDGSFAYLNDKALEKWGYTASEATALTVPDVDPIYNKDKFAEVFKLAQTGPLGTFETVHQTKAGFQYPVEINMGGIMLNDIPYLFGIARDITERKKAEKEIEKAFSKLEESEARFRHVADSAPVLIWMAGTDKLGYFFNKAWLNFTGRTYEEEKGNGWADNLHPEDAKRCLDIYINSFNKREPFYMEFRLKRHDDEYRWLSDNGVPRFSSNGDFEGYICACNDIHDLVEYQLRLEQNEDKLNVIIEASGLGNWEWQLSDDSVIYSDRYVEIFGYEKDAVLSHKDILERYHPEDVEKRNQAIKESLQTGSLHYTARIIWSNNSLHWIEIKGKVFYDANLKPARLLGTIRDITEEKNYQKELQERETKFRLLADSMPQFVWTASPDGVLNYFNKAVYDYTGLSPRDVDGEGWLQIVHPDEREENIKQWIEAISTGNDFLFEHRFRKADGQYRWQLSRATPQRDETGQIQMWVGSSTDIQDIKEKDQQKDYFISMASHELKTPITSIKGYVQILQSVYKAKGDEFLVNSLSVINRQVNSLTQLITDLLDVSKIKSGALLLNIEPFDLESLIQETIEEMGQINPEYKISYSGAGAGTFINGDRNRIGQVLVNFLTNAVKYSPEQGKIVVTLTSNNTEVTVSVKDFGIGISKQDQEKIFERFYRVEGKNEKTFPGFGIGLFIAATIIQKHKGSIAVKSEPGVGSIFYFTLAKN